MKLKIYQAKSEWNKSPYGNQKQLLFVEFPNCISTKTNKSFKWLPTYEQLAKIKEELDIVEKQWQEVKRRSKAK